MKPRVVLDTNIVVSALLKPGRLEDQVLRLGLDGAFTICTSLAILSEYAAVLPRPRLKLTEQEIRTTLEELRKIISLVHPSQTLLVCPHEPDNRFLECADAASADFLVTGNTRHFPPVWKTTRIVNARQFLEYLAAEQSDQ
jgi:putative PIN family toxin of toxin-antitoxin system